MPTVVARLRSSMWITGSGRGSSASARPMTVWGERNRVKDPMKEPRTRVRSPHAPLKTDPHGPKVEG